LEGQLTASEAERAQLEGRLASVEEELRQRDTRIQQLGVDAELLRQAHEATVAVLEEVQRRGVALRAWRDQLQQELDTVRNALSERIASLEQEVQARDRRVAQLEKMVDAGAKESSERQETLGQREAEWVAARDELARQLAEEHSQSERVREEMADATARACSLEEQLASRVTAEENLASRVAALEQELVDRDNQLVQLRDDLAQLQQRSAQELSASHDAASQREAELVAERGVTAQQLVAEQERARAALEENAKLGEQLRSLEAESRDRGSGEEAGELRAEIARLEAKIGEIEQQHGDAVQRHSAAVAGYMVELNQRSEALHQRNQELQNATEELSLTRQTCEHALAQLESVRRERADLERQLQEDAGGSRPGASAGNGSARPLTLKLQDGASVPAPPAAKPAQPARPMNGSGATRGGAAAPSAAPQGPMVKTRFSAGPVTVIHLEENKALHEPVREIIGRLPGARYLNAIEGGPATGPGPCMLAINLLNRTQDPLPVLTASIAANSDQEEVFAYCADGTCGFSFGTVDFFAHPIDVDACVTRLLERRGAVQRLLAVSENVEMTGALREVLSRMRCSTSVAFDVRQAIDLLPMIKPEVVLVDFALPRGEGLRLVSRLRSDPKTREIPMAVLLPGAANAADFRQHALRAARESRMSPAQLAQALAQWLRVPAGSAERAKGAGMLQTG